MKNRDRAAKWYQGSSDTEHGRVLTLDGLLKGLPTRRESVWLLEFWRRVEKGIGDDACWTWIGSQTVEGYGVLSVNRQVIRAHRLSYLLANGSLCLDRYVLHRCDRPSCVNPAHLFLGTAADNAADMVAKGRNSRLKLTARQVRAIRRRKLAGESIRALAFRYQVAPSTIWHVTAGRTWKHVAVVPQTSVGSESAA